MKQKIDFYEKHYQHDFFNLSNRYQELFLMIKKFNPQKFLDLGCGDGSFSKYIKKELNNEVYGVDIAQRAIIKARTRRIKGYALDLDQQNLPFKNNFFDCVFCGELLEHLYSPDRVLKEIYRVTKKGGIVIITTPNLASWFNRLSLLFGFQPIFSDIALNYSAGHLWSMDPMGHLRLYTLRALKKMVMHYGFKIVEVKGMGINNRVGFGKAHPLLAKLTNFIFRSPSLNSTILLVAKK